MCPAGGPADRRPLPPPNQTEERWVLSSIPPHEFAPGLSFPEGEASHSLSHKDVQLLPVTRSPKVTVPWLCGPFPRLESEWVSTPAAITAPGLTSSQDHYQGGKQGDARVARGPQGGNSVSQEPRADFCFPLTCLGYMPSTLAGG